MTYTTRSEHACHGGRMGFYEHQSATIGLPMRFGVFVPGARSGRLPAVYFLAGLTCTEETFAIKAGALQLAYENGLILVMPDTSPRGAGIAGEEEDWDFGVGAGFYLNAAAEPWSRHYRMADYVSRELPALVEEEFPAQPGQRGLFGHSMGGHGALVLALREPERWASVSALAPISNPSEVPWGQKAFSRYLGPDRAAWAEWDACELMRRRAYPGPILVDQGAADQFLERELHPQALRQAADASGQQLDLRMHEGYDHSYWFIQSFMADHIAHHARQLV